MSAPGPEHEAALIGRHVHSHLATVWTDSGEWVGRDKSGIGVYTYPSKASYAGQWSNNLKDGYGIYVFPKGGLYKVEHRRDHAGLEAATLYFT